jgi:hypothetical protein
MFQVPQCSTDNKPAVRETLIFEGLLRCSKSVAEREGFPTDDRGFSKNTVKQGIPEKVGEGL